jgi:hypothetical protein
MATEQEEQEVPGEKTLTAPEGCGFMDTPVLPVQVHLMCTDCEAPMFCIAEAAPLIMVAAPQGRPEMDYIHQCVGPCKKKVRMKQPWPTIRYAPHPTFSVATPEQRAEMEARQAADEAQAAHQLAMLNEAFPDEDPTPPVSEAPSDSSSEEE